MAITYQAGRRIQGATTDYNTVYDSSGNLTGTHTSDNTEVDGWLAANKDHIKVNGGNIKWDLARSSTNYSISYDLGANVSNEKWVLRFRATWDAITACAGNEQYIGISSLNSTNAQGASHDFLGCDISMWASNPDFRNVFANNSDLNGGGASNWNSDPSRSAGDFYFIEIKRLTTTTFAISFSSTDSYDGDLASSGSQTCSADTKDMRYIYMCSENAGATECGHDCLIDNIEFYDGYTTPTTVAKPTDVQVGSRFEETDTRKIYHRIIQGQWLEEGSDAYGGRGVFMGGYNNVIDYITISTLGNAADFGDLSTSSGAAAGVSDYTRGVIAMGDSTNVMEYITIATTGNSTDFGDRTVSVDELAGCSNHTRGIFLGGDSNVLDYITITTTGNATDFGDRTVNGQAPGACASETRGVFAGGKNSGTVTNVIDYVTIASTGNATNFGDLTQARRHVVGLSNDTRGVFGGGLPSGYTNVIDYITIATTGNATDFGDLLVAGYGFGGTASETRGVFAGANVGGTQNVIQYITIATTGNATDFGDLTRSNSNMAGVSDT